MRLIDADRLNKELQTLKPFGMIARLTWIVDRQPTVEQSKWIPCSERLPDEGKRYLVTRFDYVTDTPFLDLLWYEKGIWWNRHYTGDYAVIAWMPLPEPYTADKGDK